MSCARHLHCLHWTCIERKGSIKGVPFNKCSSSSIGKRNARGARNGATAAALLPLERAAWLLLRDSRSRPSRACVSSASLSPHGGSLFSLCQTPWGGTSFPSFLFLRPFFLPLQQQVPLSCYSFSFLLLIASIKDSEIVLVFLRRTRR